jgi:hypothetical protein
MCETCLSQCDDYGEVLPGWFLVRATKDSGITMEAGDWGLVDCNSPSFIFEHTPIKNPIVGLTIEESEESKLDEPYYRFISVSDSIGIDMFESIDTSTPNLPFSVCNKLYKSCIEAGWNEDKEPMLYWLCHHIATYLEGNPNVRRWKDNYPDNREWQSF